MLQKGLESQCPEVETFLRSTIDAAKDTSTQPSPHPMATCINDKSTDAIILSTKKLSLLRAALERYMEGGNWIATKTFFGPPRIIGRSSNRLTWY